MSVKPDKVTKFAEALMEGGEVGDFEAYGIAEEILDDEEEEF